MTISHSPLPAPRPRFLSPPPPPPPLLLLDQRRTPQSLDAYPQRFDCSHPERWNPVTTNYYDYHMETNPGQPFYSPEVRLRLWFRGELALWAFVG